MIGVLCSSLHWFLMNNETEVILVAKQRVHMRWTDVEFDQAAAVAVAAAAIAKNVLCLAGQCWLVAATYSEYAYAQRRTLWNFGFMGNISLPW